MLKRIALCLFLGIAAWNYNDAASKYDPEAVCAKQTHVSKDQCLAAVGTAMSAGW